MSAIEESPLGDRSDPSALTTAQLERQLGLLREIIETRLDAYDKAIELLQRYPTDVDKAKTEILALLSERFQRIEQAVDLKVSGLQSQIDKRLEAQAVSTSLALDAVNQANKVTQLTADKAMAKAESAAEKTLLLSMIDALRDNFAGQIIATKDQLAAAMAAAEKAVNKAETSVEKRFDSVNEFRAQLSDQAARFMPRTEAETWSRAQAEKIDMLQSRMDRLEGRSGGMTQSWGILVAAVGLIATIIATAVILGLKP